MLVEFSPNVDLSEGFLSDVRLVLSDSHQESRAWALDAFLESATVQVAGLFVDQRLASFLFYMRRDWRYGHHMLVGYSVGLVTTLNDFRGNGFGTELIERFAAHSRNLGLDFIYLVGIPDFYNRLGFKSAGPQCKFIFEVPLANLEQPRIRQACATLVPSIRSLYESFSLTVGSSFVRSDSDWSDLVGPLSKSFLFYDPHVVLNSSNEPAGYFCYLPGVQCEFREVTMGSSLQDTLVTINALMWLARADGRDKVEVFSSYSGPLRVLSTCYYSSQFIASFSPNRGPLVLGLSNRFCLSRYQESFVLQGDNL